MKKTSLLSTFLQSFFMDYLILQRQVSNHTLTSYRDTFRLFLQFCQAHLHKSPSNLNFNDMSAGLVRRFLSDIETSRKVCARTRNQRLAAIHSCFHFASIDYPEYSDTIQQILAIPQKRYKQKSIDYLTSEEIDSLLSVPDKTNWLGRRDYTLLLVGIRTGLRVSELTHLKKGDVAIGASSYIHCFGKGRKERTTPLTKNTANVVKHWLKENEDNGQELLFTNARHGQLTHDGIQYIMDKHIKIAQEQSPSLKKKRVTPHVMRHTTAMQLLQSGVDPMMIAIWLGHESVDTTQIYIKEDMKMKESALKKTQESQTETLKYKPKDDLLAFLESL